MLLPFALLLMLYVANSAARLAENPNDKLLPSIAQMASAVERMAFNEDKRSGEYLFWNDTASSLQRLGTGIAIGALLGLCYGIAAGVLPLFGTPMSPLMAVLSMVPPLAILPILFIVFGLGELSKVMLIVIGITPVLARDLEQRAREIPQELLIKAQPLGPNTWTLVLRVVLPQLMPRLLIATHGADRAADVLEPVSRLGRDRGRRRRAAGGVAQGEGRGSSGGRRGLQA